MISVAYMAVAGIDDGPEWDRLAATPQLAEIAAERKYRATWERLMAAGYRIIRVEVTIRVM